MLQADVISDSDGVAFIAAGRSLTDSGQER